MGKSIKGTRTEKNLLTSFAGESQARMRYTYFASVAKKEGYEQIAALFQKTARLPNVELAMSDKVLGCTAVSQIQAGAVMGYIGAMEYLIRRTKQEMGYPEEEIKVVATGGLSRMVADNTDMIDLVDKDLILDGLRLIYRRYREAQK